MRGYLATNASPGKERWPRLKMMLGALIGYGFVLSFLTRMAVAGFPGIRHPTIYFKPDSFTDPAARRFAELVVKGDITGALRASKAVDDGVSAIAPDGVTALLIAVNQENRAMVEALLRAGADPNGGPTRAPLAQAISAGDLSIARLLLQARADPNGCMGEESALNNAAMMGKQDAIALLLEFHAQVNQADGNRRFALLTAAATRNWSTVVYLLDHGASLWVTEELGITLATWCEPDRPTDDSPQGRLRQQVIDRLKAAGFPWPPPTRQEVQALRLEGKWPPAGVQAP